MLTFPLFISATSVTHFIRILPRARAHTLHRFAQRKRKRDKPLRPRQLKTKTKRMKFFFCCYIWNFVFARPLNSYCSYCYARALCSITLSLSPLFAIVCYSNFVFVSSIVVVVGVTAVAVGNSISSQFGVAVDK